MIFSMRLKETRKLRNLTQKELAYMLAGTPNKVASWEQGRTEPSLADIVKLCKLLDVTSDYLLGITEY